jgi:ABC-type iron transport system FetAB ATPase subunit
LLTLSGLRTALLSPVHLELGRGECVTLSGVSGAGKTQLLRAIADLDPHQGEVLLAGQTQETFAAPEWRRRVAFLPAESHWWGTRVEEHFRSLAPGLLEILGLDPRCPTWEVERLSSGERQRLALARLLSGDPEVLLLDEPTANLDPGNARRIEELIEKYRRQHGAGVLWVSHDPEQSRRVGDRAFTLREGRLEAAA